MDNTRSRGREPEPAFSRIPTWYYWLLIGIALVGLILIAFSMRTVPIISEGVTEEGDYPQGSSTAPVTVFEWGSFT